MVKNIFFYLVIMTQFTYISCSEEKTRKLEKIVNALSEEMVENVFFYCINQLGLSIDKAAKMSTEEIMELRENGLNDARTKHVKATLVSVKKHSDFAKTLTSFASPANKQEEYGNPVVTQL